MSQGEVVRVWGGACERYVVWGTVLIQGVMCAYTISSWVRVKGMLYEGCAYARCYVCVYKVLGVRYCAFTYRCYVCVSKVLGVRDSAYTRVWYVNRLLRVRIPGLSRLIFSFSFWYKLGVCVRAYIESPDFFAGFSYQLGYCVHAFIASRLSFPLYIHQIGYCVRAFIAS